MYKQICDIPAAAEILEPLLDVEQFTRDELFKNGWQREVRSGRFKRRIHLSFKAEQLQSLRIPTSLTVRFFKTKLAFVLLYEHQGDFTSFDLVIKLTHHARTNAFEKAVHQVCCNIVGGNGRQLERIELHSTFGGETKDETLRNRLAQKAGYMMEHYIIDTWDKGIDEGDADDGDVDGGQGLESEAEEEEDKISQKLELQSESSNFSSIASIIVDDRGKIFNVQEFTRGCICILEDLLLFTNNDFIRELQLDTNPQREFEKLRLLNHKPIVTQLWEETMGFALNRPQCKAISTFFTQEQNAILYNCNKQEIENTFNRYVLGHRNLTIQPHPVRALLDHLGYLWSRQSFDLVYYDMYEYGVNFILTAYYLGKNFLTHDRSLLNTRGAICFNGVPGSGKSKLQSIIGRFMNAFSFEDMGKGIAEFENYDIVSKSFIKVEEVDVRRLLSNEWKLLADLEVPVKCRIKNEQDVEISKYVPVTITTNGDIYTEIIQKSYQDLTVAAAHRRWGFVRYFDSWHNAHACMYTQYQSIYESADVEEELMNSLLGCALLFTRHDFAMPDYILEFYASCVLGFAETFFGQVFLRYYDVIVPQIMHLSDIYCGEGNMRCMEELKNVADLINRCEMQYLEVLKNEIGLSLWPKKMEEMEHMQYIVGQLEDARISKNVKDKGIGELWRVITGNQGSSKLFQFFGEYFERRSADSDETREVLSGPSIGLWEDLEMI